MHGLATSFRIVTSVIAARKVRRLTVRQKWLKMAVTQRGSLLSLLVVVAVSFWPFNNLCHRDGNGIRACILAITVYFFWLNYIIYCLSVINNKRLSLECIIIFCQKKDLLDQAGYLIDFCVLFFCPTTIVSLSSPLAPPCFCPDFYIRKKVHYEDARK